MIAADGSISHHKRYRGLVGWLVVEVRIKLTRAKLDEGDIRERNSRLLECY